MSRSNKFGNPLQSLVNGLSLLFAFARTNASSSLHPTSFKLSSLSNLLTSLKMNNDLKMFSAIFFREL